VFVDESGFLLTPTVRRTLAPRGKTPILKTWDRHDRISAISAVTVSPKRRRLGLVFQLLPDDQNAHGEDTVAFLRQLRRHLPGPMTVLWDRCNIHNRAKVVRAYLAGHREIRTEKLPGYAPETNPDEMVWEHTKHGRLANFTPEDTAELRSILTRSSAGSVGNPSCCRRSSGMPRSGSGYGASPVSHAGISMTDSV
jgi:hypothetical protein